MLCALSARRLFCRPPATLHQAMEKPGVHRLRNRAASCASRMVAPPKSAREALPQPGTGDSLSQHRSVRRNWDLRARDVTKKGGEDIFVGPS